MPFYIPLQDRIMDADDVKEFNGGYQKPHYKDKRQRYSRNIWDQFVAQSTLHGLHYVFEKRPVPQRLFWLILNALMFSLFLWQTLNLALAFLDYNVSSTIEFVTERESSFPAVTLCNFNMYRKSEINNTEFYEVLKEKNPLYPKNITIDWKKYANVNTIDVEDLILKAGHQMSYNETTGKGMLYGCKWKGKKCGEMNFTRILTDMGLCYMFNSGKDTPIRKVNAPGKQFGLHLRMSVEQDEYVGHVAFSAGLRIRIHDPDEPPLVSSLGFAVMPGSHVFASISRQRTKSLKSPFKTMCQDKDLPGIKAYTIAACHENCKQNHIAKECRCRPFYMKENITEFKQKCTVEKYFDCVLRIEGEFSSSSLDNCQCTEPCDTMKYSTYLSYGTFPGVEAAKEYANGSVKALKSFTQCDDISAALRQYDEVNDTDEEDEFTCKNLLAMDIFYEDLNYHVIKQVPAYSLPNLLGEIGGLMGLFLGASILTVLEFFDVGMVALLTRLGIYRPL
ncbi:acid-sensing ion channel 4-A-like isoform X2 [Dendronephthya gigantea]|uniref:acid-sensing ion channel 4-A-like isoform X2 n=1 Tax=Dendronephthya gigantea TaxID=151771 RepID=UPI00106AEC64|nr:acid-sensing ion channel 4-A-like isoform X2 [Dendronephthya gigantea]XP_028407227.1 acid-sensing ion channel 4-A-like isoform X2 [Dendronephthya gigantea]XP_028407236.1 acid-sensing ion channel 4-A-like isoform X2 [Dendronephthya gigantea]XP_028407244.1 acid-sensing ion channel 4-A-like isoform X2 [Dendronephthya gigantea]